MDNEDIIKYLSKELKHYFIKCLELQMNLCDMEKSDMFWNSLQCSPGSRDEKVKLFLDDINKSGTKE